MALSQAGLREALLSLFADPPLSSSQCAQAWADAMASYAAAIVPSSAAVTAAAATLSTALAAAFQAPSAVAGMESSFGAFAVAVGLGMAGFTPTPPPLPVGFAAQFASPFPVTHEDAADDLSALIHAWLTTGTATLVAPPFTVTPWS